MRSFTLFKKSTLFCIFVIFNIGTNAFALNENSKSSCQFFLNSQTTEKIGDSTVLINRLDQNINYNAKTHPGTPISEVFGDEPVVIFGVDTSNSRMPYLIIGDKTFRVTDSRDETHIIFIYNAATKTSLPHPIITTIYKLGSTPSELLRPGYFFRIKGLSQQQIIDIQSRMDGYVNQAGGVENESWTGVVSQLMEGLQASSGIQLNCADRSCDYISDLLKKSIEFGFTDEKGSKFELDFYLADYPTLALALKKEKRNMVVHKIALGSLLTMTGASVLGTLYITYNMIAMHFGLPELPMP